MTVNQDTNPYINLSVEFDRKLLKVKLDENGEKMISLKKLAYSAGVKIVFNHMPIILNDDTKTFFLREQVGIYLIEAAKKINSEGYIIQVQDAYRHPLNQKAKFVKRVNEIKLGSPAIDDKKLLEKANMYTAGIPILAAHTAGAAVDVILLDRNFKKIDMGSEYPEGRPESKTTHPGLPKKILELRKLLVSAMESSGFTNYPFEWWHFSSGDVCAAHLNNKTKAIYGPVYFEPESGVIKPMPKDQCYSYFAI